MVGRAADPVRSRLGRVSLSLILSALIVLALIALVGVTVLDGCRTGSVQGDSPDAVTKYIDDLSSKDIDVRIAAAIALADYPESVSKFIRPLAMLLASRDSGERLAAQRALEHLGPAAADALEPLIKSDEILDYILACDCIASIGAPAARWIDDVGRGLASDESLRRRAGAMAVVGLGPLAKDHVPSLVRIADSGEFQAQLYALRAIIAIGPEARAAGPVLLKLHREGNVSVRSYAAWALGAVAPLDDVDVVAELSKALDAYMQPERERAIRGLSLMGPSAAPTLPAIREQIDDPDSDIQPYGAMAIWKIEGNSEEAVRLLLQFVRDPTYEVASLELMGEMGAAAAPAVDYLISRVDDEDDAIRDLVVVALGRIGGDKVVPAIKSRLEDPSPMVRFSARRALERVQGS
jgi:HEAT repeat protein